MTNQKLYILKGNVKNPGWELRNQGVFVKKSDAEGLREMQYVPGADSIWKHENEKQGKPKSVWFVNGSLIVNADDKLLIDFLEKHPDFNKDYELYDPEAKASAEFEQLEAVEKARELLRKISDDEDKMAATAASVFGAISMNWKEKETKLRLYKYADSKPKEIVDALEDPAAEAKYIAALGLRKKVVDTNPQRTAVIWNDSTRGVICSVAAGQKALNVLGDFLFKEDNLVTLQEIGNRLDALDGKKPKKKVVQKQKTETNEGSEEQ